MRPFSLCMIVKNEEKNIEKCLKAVQSFDCEILVVDTGSTDRTVEIAQKYATKVLHFTWINDFAAARNFSIANASYDWVLVLDCDEFVEKASPEQFLLLAEENPICIGLLERINLTNPDNRKGAYTDPVPRFFNRKYFHYEGAIHEQVHSIEPRKLEGFHLPLTVIHTGYIGTPEEKKSKHLRNLTLLQKELLQKPNDIYFHFQIGQEYYNLFDYATALEYYKFVIDNGLNSKLEYHRLTVIAYHDCLAHVGKLEEAKALKNYENDFGYSPDFHCLMGRIYYLSGELLKAMSEFIIATSMNNPFKEGTNTYLSWYHIGLINETLGDNKNARLFYEKCGDYEPAIKRLTNLSDI